MAFLKQFCLHFKTVVFEIDELGKNVNTIDALGRNWTSPFYF